MRKFWSVSGQLVEVQRYINVPMRWCEQYPARERRELWVSTTSGNDIKLIVHSREMPARRGHQVTALLLGERMVGMYNSTTGKQVNYLRTDPPLLWRRCDAVAVTGLLLISAKSLELGVLVRGKAARTIARVVDAIESVSTGALGWPSTASSPTGLYTPDTCSAAKDRNSAEGE